MLARERLESTEPYRVSRYWHIRNKENHSPCSLGEPFTSFIGAFYCCTHGQSCNCRWWVFNFQACFTMSRRRWEGFPFDCIRIFSGWLIHRRRPLLRSTIDCQSASCHGSRRWMCPSNMAAYQMCEGINWESLSVSLRITLTSKWKEQETGNYLGGKFSKCYIISIYILVLSCSVFFCCFHICVKIT